MNYKYGLFILLLIFLSGCGRHVKQGTTIKIVNDSGVENDDISTFKHKLREKLEDFNFAVLSSGETDYTIRIASYDHSSHSWSECPSDDCSNSCYTLNGETTSITASLCEYNTTELESWTFYHDEGEKLKKRENSSDGCYNYYVRTPLFDLFEGNMNSFARRTARRVSRIVYRKQ